LLVSTERLNTMGSVNLFKLDIERGEHRFLSLSSLFRMDNETRGVRVP
jgi:hypothetical protein